MKFVKRQEIVEDFQKQFHDKKILLEKNTLPSWINVKNTVDNPLSALFVLPPIDNTGRVKDKKDLFNLLTKNCLVLGDAGIGKSTLLRYIFAHNSDSNTLVAYYTAEEWNSQKEDAKTYLKLTKTKTVLIIDGLDEAFHMNPGGCKALLRELSELSRKHKNVKIWIGCRKAFFEKLRSNCVAFEYEKVQLKAWKEKQAKSFIKNYQEYLGSVARHFQYARCAAGTYQLYPKVHFVSIPLFAENNEYSYQFLYNSGSLAFFPRTYHLQQISY